MNFFLKIIFLKCYMKIIFKKLFKLKEVFYGTTKTKSKKRRFFFRFIKKCVNRISLFTKKKEPLLIPFFYRFPSPYPYTNRYTAFPYPFTIPQPKGKKGSFFLVLLYQKKRPQPRGKKRSFFFGFIVPKKNTLT